MNRTFGLRTALILLLSIAVVPVFGVVIQSSVAEQRNRLERAETNLKALVELSAAHQEQLIEGARQMLTAISHAPPVYEEDTQACARYFRQLQSKYPGYTNFGLLDRQGNLVCRATQNQAAVNASDRIYFSSAVATGKFTVGEYIVGRATGRPSIAFGMPVYHEDKSLRGVIFVALDLEQADAQLRKLPLPPDTTLLVTDLQGLVLASAGHETLAVGTQLPEGKLLETIKIHEPGQGTLGPEGEEDLYASRPVGKTGEGTLVVTGLLERDSVLRPATERLTQQLAALTFLALAAGAAAWIFGDRILARPIQSQLRRIQALARHESPLDIARSHSRLREIRLLEDSLHEMARILTSQSVQRDAALAEMAGQKALLESVFESLDEGVIVANAKGRFIHANAAALRITPGLLHLNRMRTLPNAPVHSQGMFYLDGVTPLPAEDRPAARALRGEQFNNLRLVLRPPMVEGDAKVVQVSARPLAATGGGGCVVAFTDITLAHAAENALREASEFSRQVIMGAQEGIAVFDRELRYQVFNPILQELTTWREQDVIGRTPAQIMGPEASASIMRRLGRALQGEVVKSGDEYYARSDITPERWIASKASPLRNSAGEVVGVIAVTTDITARKQSEAAMAESEQRYRKLFESNPHPMWVFDVETLRFLTVNDAAVNHYGYSREEFLAMTILDIRPPEDAAAVTASARKPVQGITTAAVWRHRRKDGSFIFAEVTSHGMLFDDRPAKLVLAHDVTERKQAREALVHLNETLEQRVADRTRELALANKELESFSYSVSHDLRAPLQVIDGFSRALQAKHADRLDGKAVHYLNRIRAGTAQMSQLIDDLLSLARVTRAEIRSERVDLGQKARQVVEQLATRFPEREVRVEIEDDLIALGDSRLLAVVLDNLIGNAWKFTGRQDAPLIRVGKVKYDGHWAFFVGDNGAGFDMAYANKLFQAFQRLHSTAEFEGTGIGLATVYRIITRHGGRVWAQSAPGEGTTFFFTLSGVPDEQEPDPAG
ncbi:MAG: PAS domain S-box protein [Burkholderiaceae bacterium]